MNFKNKKIVITGGSLGIGLAIAKQLAIEGATIIIAARNDEELAFAKKELLDLTSRDHYAYRVDVSKWTDVKIFAEWVEVEIGVIDGLVNCAGIYGPIGKTVDIEPEEILKTIEINLMGTIHMCGAFCKLFSNDNKKKIVNFSGGGAVYPFPNYSAYALSKVAIVRLTENLALELADDNFDVNCVAPGFVNTRLHAQTLKAGVEKVGVDFYEKTIKQLYDGATPVEKAVNLTSFLLSEESDGITGKIISAVWDDYTKEEIQTKLKYDKDFATLKRIDEKTFQRK
jgi:NAD(P)-dependent dehydrogenase (short-subunit alcohol dehydrogenase family)